MNFIPAIGPFDITVLGSQKGYLGKPIEFIIQNENVSIQEILILNPNGKSSSCDIADKQLNGHLSLEFIPDRIGKHEIRIYSDKKIRDLYNSFDFFIYDSSKILLKSSGTAVVGKTYSFTAKIVNLPEGELCVYIEQEDRKIRPLVKNIQKEADSTIYEVSFVPEVESMCKIDLEYINKFDNILNGNMFKLDAKALDFLMIPFPLMPFQINTRCSFKIKILREFVRNLKVFIKPMVDLGNSQECELVLLEKDFYQVFFTPKTIEKHYVEIYFGSLLINIDRLIKIDVFDVSKITSILPKRINFGELNTFSVDTSGAGEGNLEVIIKDGFDTLKAQLLKREKRRFEIGFLSERNTKHSIQIVFNGVPIKDSPFDVLPEYAVSKSEESQSEMPNNEISVIEGGPIENIQCSEKMWLIYDIHTSVYSDVHFVITDESNLPIKHTKIQLEDGRWRVEFIPINTGIHKIKRIIQTDNSSKIQTLSRINVLNFSSQRAVYGYKLYSIEESVQLVFDAADFKVNDISIQIKDPNEDIIERYECKYLSDYIAIKFKPRLTGKHFVYFFDKTSHKMIASSPYKLIVHESLKEIMRSSGVYGVTRLVILSKNFDKEFKLNQFNVKIYDSQHSSVKNCFFFNKNKDLVIEFVSRMEGMHKIYLYINDDLVDGKPFIVYVNGESEVANAFSNVLFPFTTFKNSLKNNINMLDSHSSHDSNTRSLDESTNSLISQPNVAQGSTMCAKKNTPFHFVIQSKNLQGLCVYDPLNEPVSFKLTEDEHENGSVAIVPKLEGTHKIVGLIEGRDFETNIFVLTKPEYESLFEMDNYTSENTLEKPYVIKLKEPNLEVDVYDPLGERVDVRYSIDNLATFVPRTTGYFKIYISDYHGPVMGSPFYALVHAKRNINCIESSGIRDTILNEETTFVIRSKELEIDVLIKDPFGKNLAVKKKRVRQGFLRIWYTPQIIGLHEISITKNGIRLQREVIGIFVSDPNKVKIENVAKNSLVNQKFSFNIDAAQAGEGFIRVNIKDPKFSDILPEISELADRKYLVSFLPEIKGTYEFSLTFNKYHLAESPFKINIVEPSGNNSGEKLSHREQEPHCSVTQSQLNDSNIEYELTNWNKQINNSLNKIMESVNQNQNNRSLSPITDTSEEEESGSLVYKGETYIENVERLPDGTSQLLLRIDENPDLIDSSNPNKARGRYKYRLKRVPLPENWSDQQMAETSLFNDSTIDLNENFIEDIDPELMALAERQDMAKTGLGGFIRRISNLEDIKEETETYSSSSLKSSSIAGAKRKESSKSKHFKVDSNNRSFDSCETMGDIVRSLTLSESESESEINVGNESSVTKVTRAKQRKINLEKTVIIEENYVIEPKSELVSRIPKRISSDKNSKSESSISSVHQNEIRITTNESGKNKPKTKEKIAIKQKTQPNTTKVSCDEKLSEKFKPEESIQYEYEHVIEDRSQHNTPEPDNKKNIQIENVQLKKTKSKTSENFETSKESGMDSVKTTTTQRTVLITETHEDKIVETIDNEKNSQEFSYSQKRDRDAKLTNLKNNLAQLAERLNPILVQEDEKLHSAISAKQQPVQSLDESKLYVLNNTESISDKDLSSAAPSFNSYENIVEYYKLQPNQYKSNKVNEQNTDQSKLQEVGLNRFETGELKPNETVSFDQLASYSRGFTTKVSDELKSNDKNRFTGIDEDEDSLAEIEENFVITFKSPLENEPLVESELKPLILKSDLVKKNICQHNLVEDSLSKSTTNSLDYIKAKFENNESHSDKNRSKSNGEEIGKLPKSKLEMYTKENGKKSESDSLSSRKASLTRLSTESKETEKNSKSLETEKKNELTKEEQMTSDSLDKGVKNLMNKYERTSSRDSTSKELTSDSLESKPIRKLSQNIVQLFDRKDSSESNTERRSKSSYRSSGSDNVEKRESKSTIRHSSPGDQHLDKNDDVFLDNNDDNDSNHSNSSRVRKLSKIFNQKSRENSQSDSHRKSRLESKIPMPQTKNNKDKKLSDSFRKFEEKSKRLYESSSLEPDVVVNDPAVKDLVSSNEPENTKGPSIKKILSTFIEDSKPGPGATFSDTSSTTTSKKFSSSSDRTLSPSSPTTKELKQEEKNIKKLISKYEIPRFFENFIEPNENCAVGDNLKFDIDLTNKQSKEHSVDHMLEGEEKGVKRLVGIYDKRPRSTSKHSLSSDSLNTKSVPTQNSTSDKALNADQIKSICKEIQTEFFSDDKLEQNENNVYENKLGNLSALVHIPGQTRGRKKAPKIRALLKIGTDEDLNFNVTSNTGQRIPYRVKRKDKMTFLMFSYHRVVDFNVGILNKSETKHLPKNYTAQLEIKISDDYDFKIVKRDNLDLIPFEIKKNCENIYEISFQPSATSSYILQAFKNETENKATMEHVPEKTIQDYEKLINKAKNEIYKKLNDVNQTTNVLLQVEHTNPINFFISDSLTNELKEFKFSYKPRNRHIAFFDYDSLTDFSIEVQKNKFREELSHRFKKENSDLLNASIELTSSNDSQIEIFRKDNQELLKLNILPKINDSCKILFKPEPFVQYTLRIFSNSKDSLEVNTIKSKLNQVIDNLSNEIFIPNSNSDIKLNLSVNKSEVNQNSQKDYELTCKIFNPKNLDVQKLGSSTNFASFLVNTQNYGIGTLKSHATNSDLIHAYVEQKQLDRWTYSVKVFGNSKTGPFKLYLDYL